MILDKESILKMENSIFQLLIMIFDFCLKHYFSHKIPLTKFKNCIFNHYKKIL